MLAATLFTLFLLSPVNHAARISTVGGAFIIGEPRNARACIRAHTAWWLPERCVSRTTGSNFGFAVDAAEVSGSTPLVAIASPNERTVEVFTIVDGTFVPLYQLNSSSVDYGYDVAVAPDGSCLAVADPSTSTVDVRRASDGSTLRLVGSVAPPSLIAWLTASTLLVASGGTLRAYDVKNEHVADIEFSAPQEFTVESLAVAADGASFLVGLGTALTAIADGTAAPSVIRCTVHTEMPMNATCNVLRNATVLPFAAAVAAFIGETGAAIAVRGQAQVIVDVPLAPLTTITKSELDAAVAGVPFDSDPRLDVPQIATTRHGLILVPFAGAAPITVGVPRDCVWSGFGPYENCTTVCGLGTELSQRTEAITSLFGGAPCVGPSTQSRACARYPSGWEFTAPSSCNQLSCGAGERVRTPFCLQCDGVTVVDGACAAPKPSPVYLGCVSWTYEWTATSGSCMQLSCGMGEVPVTVRCRRCDMAIVNDSFCDPATRPQSSIACDGIADFGVLYAPFRVQRTAWTLDDTSCQNVAACGVSRERTEYCMACDNNVVSFDRCSGAAPATDTEQCPCSSSGPGVGCEGSASSCVDKNGCGGGRCSYACTNLPGNFFSDPVQCIPPPPPPPPVPPPPPPSGGGGGGCICNDTATVALCDPRTGQHVGTETLRNLLPGGQRDTYVLTPSGCERFVVMLFRQPGVLPRESSPRYRICAGHGTHCVVLTFDHLLLDGSQRSRLPSTFAVGDTVLLRHPSTNLQNPAVVTSVTQLHSTAEPTGLYAPYTTSGEVFVDGIAVSSFTFNAYVCGFAFADYLSWAVPGSASRAIAAVFRVVNIAEMEHAFESHTSAYVVVRVIVGLTIFLPLWVTVHVLSRLLLQPRTAAQLSGGCFAALVALLWLVEP